MLKAIRVTNFKIINDSSLVPLKPLTLLIGRNGSGKSSLVEVLDWLGKAVHSGATEATEQFHNITDILNGWANDPTRTFGITLEFDPQDASVGEKILYRVEVGVQESDQLPCITYEQLSCKTVDGENISIRSDGSTRERRRDARLLKEVRTTTFTESKDKMSKTTIKPETTVQWVPTTHADRLALSEIDPVERGGDLLKRFLERAVFLRLNPRSIARFAPARTKPSPRLLDDEGLGVAYLLTQLDEETLGILVEKLSHIIASASNLESHIPASPADRRFFTFVEERSGEERPLQVPAWVLSEGTRRMTAILALLLHDHPPELLCIEEVENGLDPWTLRFLCDELTSAVERGTQVILTTHSPYLLNFVPLENIILCDRRSYDVEFLTEGSLPSVEDIESHIGLGDLYTNRYLYHGHDGKEK